MKKNFSVIHYRSRKKLEINARRRKEILFMMFDCAFGRDENIYALTVHLLLLLLRFSMRWIWQYKELTCVVFYGLKHAREKCSNGGHKIISNKIIN